MKKILIFLSFILTGQENVIAQTGNYEATIENIAQKLATSINSEGKKTITIADFTNLEGAIPELGRDISGDLEAAFLYGGYGFKLVSRDELNRIIEEQNISRSRMTEKDNVKRIGKIANVDVIIAGTVSDWGEQIKINAQLLEVETAMIIGGGKGNVTSTSTIKKKFEKLIVSTNLVTEEPTLPSGGGDRIFNHSNVEFNLISCRQSGSKIICNFIITSKNYDEELYVSGTKSTKIFDPLGGEAYLIKSTIAGYSKGRSITKDLVADLPTKAQFEFDGASKGISVIPKLEMKIKTDNGGYGLLILRKVGIDK